MRKTQDSKKYKIVSEKVKDKKVILDMAIGAKKAGFNPVITISKDNYELFYAESEDEKDTREIIKRIKEAGLNAEAQEE